MAPRRPQDDPKAARNYFLVVIQSDVTIETPENAPKTPPDPLQGPPHVPQEAPKRAPRGAQDGLFGACRGIVGPMSTNISENQS